MDEIKQILQKSVENMPIEEQAVLNLAIERVFAPVDMAFNPTVEEVERWEVGCSGETEFYN